MKRTDFCLFFSLPLDTQDWQNLNTSRVSRVMLPLPLAHARPDILAHLASLGKRIIVRLIEDYYDHDAPQRVTKQVQDIRRVVGVDAVILGVEPDNPFQMGYGSPTWGQDTAYHHREAAGRVYSALGAAVQGVEIVAAGHTMRSISEDEAPAPGQEAWAEICRPLYSAMDGVGYHLYGYGSDGHYINTVRALFALKAAQERFHKPIWIDEIAFDSGTQVQRMEAVIRFARLMEQHVLGGRVRMICPFVSNGDGLHYPSRLILKDPQAYQLLGEYMKGG